MSKIFLLTGPSGVGKSTLVKEAIKRVPNLVFIPSYTTRKPDVGEKDGVDYYFVSKKEFKEMMKRGEFIEAFKVYGEWKGSPMVTYYECLEAGYSPIKDIDVQGAKAFKEEFGNRAITIYITPPSFHCLEDRLRNRGTRENRTTREDFDREEKLAPTFDHIILNAELEDAIADLIETIASHNTEVEIPGLIT